MECLSVLGPRGYHLYKNLSTSFTFLPRECWDNDFISVIRVGQLKVPLPTSLKYALPLMHPFLRIIVWPCRPPSTSASTWSRLCQFPIASLLFLDFRLHYLHCRAFREGVSQATKMRSLSQHPSYCIETNLPDTLWLNAYLAKSRACALASVNSRISTVVQSILSFLLVSWPCLWGLLYAVLLGEDGVPTIHVGNISRTSPPRRLAQVGSLMSTLPVWLNQQL